MQQVEQRETGDILRLSRLSRLFRSLPLTPSPGGRGLGGGRVVEGYFLTERVDRSFTL
jgi:hypothetical protein